MNLELPCKAEIKYDYLIIDNVYLKYYAITKFNSKINICDTLAMLQDIQNVDVSYVINKEENIQFLKKINEIIASSKAEIITNKSQIDNNLLNKQASEAERLKYLIQIENEDIFKVAIIVCVHAMSTKDLEVFARNVELSVATKGLILKPLNFKQKESHLLSLPIKYKNELFDKVCNIFTTNSLTSLFPFYIKNTVDPNGILIGEADKKAYIFDMFNTNNLNNNICVFGSSGSGKSYFNKSLIIKNLYMGITQLVIDPEGEYEALAKELGGTVIDSNTLNVLYIFEEWANRTNNFVDKKIDNVLSVINCDDVNIIEQLRVSIRESYAGRGITNDIKTLYKSSENSDIIYINKKYLDYTSFPTISDVKRIYKLKYKKITKSVENIFNKLISSEHLENLEINKEKLIVLSLKVPINKLEDVINLFLLVIEELITENTLIYIDEVWKLITIDNRVYNMVSNMYKTIRKKNAGIITLTQDISDILKYKNGELGKSIINNSYTKIYFKMSYSDTQVLNKMLQNEEIIKKIKLLDRGSCIIDRGGMCVNVNIKNNEKEHYIIEGGQ